MNFEELFSVSGKVVCVTGGGGGIGRGIARTFVSGGAKVYIASRSDLSDVATEISEEGLVSVWPCLWTCAVKNPSKNWCPTCKSWRVS